MSQTIESIIDVDRSSGYAAIRPVGAINDKNNGSDASLSIIDPARSAPDNIADISALCQFGEMRYRSHRKTVFALIAGLALLFPAITVEACETVEYRPTATKLKNDAREFFEQEALIYEGKFLGGHDYDLGGRFLVLKTYKGPAKPFTVLSLPPGTSCYSEVTPFSVGFWSDYSAIPASFDGLVSTVYVDSWTRQGLVDGGVLTPRRLVIGIPLFIIALIILIALQLRKRRDNSA